MGKFSRAVGGGRDGVKGRDTAVAGAWGAALAFSTTPGVQLSPVGGGTSHVPHQGDCCSSGTARSRGSALRSRRLTCCSSGWGGRARGLLPVLPPPHRSRLGEAGACWLPEHGLPWECSGPVPRILCWVFVCCCAPEVWCYCDRKRERRGGEASRLGMCL